MINWNKTTFEEMLLISRITKQACTLDPTLNALSVQMDLEACHTCGCPLDLQRPLAADQANLMHDIGGIRRHINRDTGMLQDCFVPRFAMQS
jgi:hypothetical protein